MNKNHGLTAGAVVLTGLTGFLLRPLATLPGGTAAELKQAAAEDRAALSSALEGEGPWIASCDYWAAVRPQTGDHTRQLNLSVKVNVNGNVASSSTTAAVAETASCPGAAPNRWGIPESTPAASANKPKPATVAANKKTSAMAQRDLPDTTPQITAIIATVPDPTREHLALDFDHTIDGLLQAANDNGYLESYSWLPWKDPGETSTAIELTTTGQEQLQERERERKRLKEPGLIILKYFDRTLPKEQRREKYYRVLYLFLVGNTPMEGVEGDQLANALKYERQLQKTSGVCFRASVTKNQSDCNPALVSGLVHKESDLGNASPNQESPATKENSDLFQPSARALAVVGPNYTGAAGSLRAQLDMIPRNQPATSSKSDSSAEDFLLGIDRIDVFAEIGTDAGKAAFAETRASAGRQASTKQGMIHFVSFAGNQAFETDALRRRTCDDQVRTAVLIEDNTAYGASQTSTTKEAQDTSEEANKVTPCRDWQIIKYPRGISLLRNAHEEEQSRSSPGSDEAPSPYLHMSLADKSEKGTVPEFSPQTATSQEAQLVAITQQLQRSRSQLVVLGGGNALDTIFLARFFHRTFPDARLMGFGADLLVNRDTDNQPLVGAVAIDAYPLVAPMPSDLRSDSPRRPFESTITESVYNAASFALWDETDNNPQLANYRDIFAGKAVDPASNQTTELHPSLWAMAVGRDAFYPLGVLEECGSNSAQILPLLHSNSKNVDPCNYQDITNNPTHFPFDPSTWWYYLCGLVLLGCILHIFCMTFASFSSLAMRDLAIDEMNNPCRRAVFIHIGTVMLFGMAFVVGFPIFPMLQIGPPNMAAVCFGGLTILAGACALVCSFYKAFPYVRREDIPSTDEFPFRKTYVYLLVHGIAFSAMVAIPTLWFLTCEEPENHVGLFFSFRCLNPLSGVSPLLPVLLLLLGWYLWSILQTRRMRFSEQTRPQIPGRLEHGALGFYVSDDDLKTGMGGTDLPLYANLTCLFITPHLLFRLSRGRLKAWHTWAILAFVYLVILFVCFHEIHPKGMERLLNGYGRILSTTWYEFLVEMLFFPLLLIALTGFLRMAVIWASLRRQLLRRLEFFPIRFAFGRMSTVGWISMMRQSDLLERQREMARSLESMRQLAHHEGIRTMLGANHSVALENWYQRVLEHVGKLRKAMQNPTERIEDKDDDVESAARDAYRSGQDFPREKFEDKTRMMYYIENDFALFGRQLLEFVLIPYWNTQREEIVESEEHETTHARRLVPGKTEGMEYAIHAGLIKEPPLHICLAEEFVAIRYVSLIRAVLVNIRHLITFVSFAWVLSMIAWNSYPFRPRETVDVIFTVLFLTLGVGVVWVFSQMYRDVLLSRITRTEGSELGSEFYIRVAMFGAIPLMTWLAYQFPAVGAVVLKYLQPGIEAVK